MWNKIQFVVIVAMLALVSILPLSALFHHLFGRGTLHVVTVGANEVSVSVDDTPAQELSRYEDHVTFEVTQGHHEVTVTDTGTGTSTTYSVDIPDPSSAVLLPVRPDQCFVRFNMTGGAYLNKKDKHPSKPVTVVGRYKNDGEPLPLPPDTFFVFYEMPLKRYEHETVYLMRDVPCALLEAKQDLLFLALSDQADALFTNMEGVINSQE